MIILRKVFNLMAIMQLLLFVQYPLNDIIFAVWLLTDL